MSSRLTKRFDGGEMRYDMGDQYEATPHDGIQYVIDVNNKLGELEDFEDKFGGCPLEKALKALEDGYFARKWDGSIVAIKSSPGVYYSHSLYKCADGWFISSENAFESEPLDLALKDYGKTWALTKEELQ